MPVLHSLSPSLRSLVPLPIAGPDTPAPRRDSMADRRPDRELSPDTPAFGTRPVWRFAPCRIRCAVSRSLPRIDQSPPLQSSFGRSTSCRRANCPRAPTPARLSGRSIRLGLVDRPIMSERTAAWTVHRSRGDRASSESRRHVRSTPRTGDSPCPYNQVLQPKHVARLYW